MFEQLAFDSDSQIPCFGFGDATTNGFGAFPFSPNIYCKGLQEVLQKYNEVTPTRILSGPTNFAALIKEAIKIVKEKMSYHILIVISDGDVNSVKETGRLLHQPILPFSLNFSF